MGIGNIPARKRGFGYDPVTRSLGIYTDGQLTASFPPTPGRTYFVNNITGASTNDGLSWGTAMDQVTTAITASTTYRELGGVESGSAVSTNDYVRNTIVIQGTGTAYTYLVDMGRHHSIVGICSPTGGMGAGTSYGGVRLGADTSNTTGGFVSTAADAQRTYGVYLANLKFQSGDASSCFSPYKFEESCIEDCTMNVSSSASATPDSFIEIQASGSSDSSFFRRLHTGSQSAIIDRPAYGFKVSSVYFINTIVEDCMICAATAGWYNTATLLYGYGSVIRNNFFGTLGHGVLATGIVDGSTRTLENGGLLTFYHNTIQAIASDAVPAEATRFINNRDDTGELKTA